MIIFTLMKKETIVEYMVKRRKSLSVTQRELAEICGVSLHALSNFESGKSNTTLDGFLKIAEALGVQVSVGVERI